MRRLLIALALLFVTAPALANVIQQTSAGVQYTLPDSWSTETIGTLVQTTSPDEQTYIMFQGLATSEFEKKVDDIASLLDEVKIEGFEPGEPSETTYNGMPIMMMDGKARYAGQPVELGLIFVLPPKSDRALIIFGLTQSDGNDKMIEKILMSLEPL